MTDAKLLINYISDDQSLADQIKVVLKQNGFDCDSLPEGENVNTVRAIVQRIETLNEENGIMIAVLSKSALSNARFISNVQYFCELASKKRVLLLVKTGSIPKENPIALYYPQAITISLSDSNVNSLNKVVLNIKRILGEKTPATIIPKRLSVQKIKRWTAGIALFSLLISVGLFFYKGINDYSARLKPTPTPTLMTPFSNKSVDQGLIIDQRFLPVYTGEKDPQTEAPFQKKPDVIQKSLTFDDPLYDGLVNIDEIYIRNNNVSEDDLSLVQQNNGVLQISASGQDNLVHEFNVPINYRYPNDDISYIGIRFKLDAYEGWTNVGEESQISLFITDEYSENNWMEVSSINPNQQIMSFDFGDYDIGTDWHVLEFVCNREKINSGSQFTIFLDGEKVSMITKPAFQNLNGSDELLFYISAKPSTDWFSIYIDEIDYGLSTPQILAEKSEDINYYLSPDKIFYKNLFNDTSIYPYINTNPDIYTVTDGTLKFYYPAGKGTAYLPIDIPINNIFEENYLAAKIRFDNPSDIWNNNLFYFFQMTRADWIANGEQPYYISFNNTNNFNFCMFPQENGFCTSASPDNYAQKAWHTIEMLFDTKDQQNYYCYFWFDGYLIGQSEVINPDLLINPDYPLSFQISIYSDININTPLSIQLDDLTIGHATIPVQGE